MLGQAQCGLGGRNVLKPRVDIKQVLENTSQTYENSTILKNPVGGCLRKKPGFFPSDGWDVCEEGGSSEQDCSGWDF